MKPDEWEKYQLKKIDDLFRTLMIMQVLLEAGFVATGCHIAVWFLT